MQIKKNLREKKEVVKNLVERFNNSAAGVFVTYSGLTVEKDTELRTKLREAGVEYTVIKNTLARFAANEVGYSEFSELFNGTTALATHESDVVAPAKVLAKFIEDNKENAGIAIKGGFMDGKISSLEEINAISKIPSKDTLYAMVACSLNATIAGFARAINAVKEQKEAPKPKAAAAKKEQPAEETPLSRTDVRAKLADLARNGFGDDVKAILKKFGADRFSEIKDEDLNALMKEAEAVGS